ncbi:hypothetical protein T492DRAFT_538511 [Pavlovales sp. CCMP2436]|nr:hypothetical protein T492DRAFT_538511 [Pavlovales sp. CCMP2436]
MITSTTMTTTPTSSTHPRRFASTPRALDILDDCFHAVHGGTPMIAHDPRPRGPPMSSSALLRCGTSVIASTFSHMPRRCPRRRLHTCRADVLLCIVAFRIACPRSSSSALLHSGPAMISWPTRPPPRHTQATGTRLGKPDLPRPNRPHTGLAGTHGKDTGITEDRPESQRKSKTVLARNYTYTHPRVLSLSPISVGQRHRVVF